MLKNLTINDYNGYLVEYRCIYYVLKITREPYFQVKTHFGPNGNNNTLHSV